jgi:excisionase family DNA binding protein
MSPVRPLAYTIAEARAVAKIGRTALYNAIRSKQLRAVKRGRRTLILDADLRRYVQALPTIEPSSDHEPLEVEPRTTGPGRPELTSAIWRH